MNYKSFLRLFHAFSLHFHTGELFYPPPLAFSLLKLYLKTVYISVNKENMQICVSPEISDFF